MFHVKDREIVTPGQLVGAGVKHDTNCYEDGEQVYSLVKGLVRIDGESVTVIPSHGGYTPKSDDTVVGIVTDGNIAGWAVDIHTAYSCFMRKDEMEGGGMPGRDGRGPPRRDERGGRGQDGGRRNFQRGPPRRDDRRPGSGISFKIGEVISAKVLWVDEVYNANLTRPWKLSDGLIITVNPKRIPRVIGKKQSMVNMIKEKTCCKIVVGQNGLVWIKGDNTTMVVEAVRKIEREAEISGLTDRVGAMLDDKVVLSSRVDENEEPGY
jgi:exosome complex component RRP4